MRRLQHAGAQAVAALWPDMPALRTASRTTDWLEVAADRLEAWKGSSAQAGARRALDLDCLAAFWSEAQAELEAVEGALIERAAAIAEYRTPASSCPSGLKAVRRCRQSGSG